MPGKTLKERPLPAGWETALKNFEATGFSWRGTSLGGTGVILYCPACRNASLIQFYQRDSEELKHACPSILASFQDHRQDDHVFLSVFDIRAMMQNNLTWCIIAWNPDNPSWHLKLKGSRLPYTDGVRPLLF